MSLIVFVISLFSNTLFAQRAYVNINVGYGFRMSSQNLHFFNFYNSTSGNIINTNEQVNVSLGKGLNIGGTFGYMINKNIGTELGVSYLIGGKSKAKVADLDGTSDYTLSSKMLRINPTIVIASGFEKINPYAKFGLIIGSGSIMYKEIYNNAGVGIMKMKLNGGIALGLSSGVGAIYKMNDKMSFYGELNMVNLSYAPTKGKITDYSYNGVDGLVDLTTNEKEIEFVDSYTYNSNNQPSDSKPSIKLKQKLPFGSFGLILGWRINLKGHMKINPK